jgi:hypothetical protein
MGGGPYHGELLMLHSPGTLPFCVHARRRNWRGFYNGENQWVEIK